jgi:dipeptidyl aminopeptidase/acylaminoacyl peptidase
MIRKPRKSLTNRLLLCALSCIFLLSATALAQSGLPPVIDRELLFGNPEIAGAQISPDGKFIAFRKPHKATMNIWVKRADEPFANARLLTNETKRPIRGFFWSRDGKFILFTNDKGGNENFNLYAVNPDEQPVSGAEVPVARNLTNSEKVRTVGYNVPRSEPDAIYVGLNDRDPAWHDLYKVKISTGERTLVRQNTERLTGWVFDNKDQLRLATRSTKTGDNEILRVDADGKFTKVYSCSVFETCSPIHFNKDNRRVYMTTNKGEAVNLVRLVLFDPETGKEEAVESDPVNRVDLNDVAFSDISDEPLYSLYIDDRQRYYFKDKTLGADYKLLQKKLPNREFSFDSSTKDETTWLISAFSDTEPGEKYLFDRKSKKLELQYRVREKLPREALAEMKPIRYKSSDGLEIPAYLALPRGITAKNLPTIILPHGGPWGRDRWGYDSMSQFLTNRGYAVLMPNFRASTGYGKKFLDAGNGQWGDKMQDDLTWGAKYLISVGISDPKRVGIMGGSYGGYATLAGVTSTPDLYAAAVAIVAPSNLITLLEAIPAYWESQRIQFYKRMGDPNTPEGKAQLMRQSPLTHADKIKTPLLVVQGANDPRVNKREADQIVIALRDRGFPVEYMVAPDEGHGFARPVNNMAMLALTEKFLAKYLGGRYQESVTPEVAKRLLEITVDPKTVKLAPVKLATKPSDK